MVLTWWLPGPLQTLPLLGGPTTEHLNGVCEQSPTTFLMATWTCCVPENETNCLAYRGGKHASSMLDWVEQAGRAELALATPT